MIDISFVIDGKKVDPNNMVDALEEALLRNLSASIKKEIGEVRCREHGQSAKVVCCGHTVSKLSIKVSGCCDELVECIESKMK
ncbi:MAG: hypothetical protein OEV59_10090 [Deltaproteobacteria bacterium]|nr:hypothetical protein [Deltaproteobacteria bacterium]